MTEFTPVSASIGGLLIGLAASLLLIASGRIAGVSGILGAALQRSDGDGAGDRLWRLAFLAGLPLGVAVYQWVGGQATIRIAAGTPVLLLAGFLVGLGTQSGSGCTSGHGVCGLARGSARSLIATATFMLAGGLTVYVVRVALGR
jgi:uncharacterized membrane protein YedE/YeeE